jgi:4,5-dihydroxyphthalate decarboxylase
MTISPRETITLRTALDTYGHTRALKDGTILPEHVRFTFADVHPMNRAFAPMAMEQVYDFSEMAIVTYLQAFAFKKPIVLLPVVMLNRFHHGSIVVRADSPIRTPKDLEGKRIGVRAYTQTTGTWTRGILNAEYGVDLSRLINVTQEGAHVRDYEDPEGCVRVGKEKPLAQMLLDGEVDAWIGGRDVPRVPDYRPVVTDAEAAELAWFERLGALPINHMAVLRRDVYEAHPWIADDIFAALGTAKREYLEHLALNGATEPEERFKATLVRAGKDPLPMGVEALRTSLDLIIDYAYAQHLIPERYAVDDLFDARMHALGT